MTKELQKDEEEKEKLLRSMVTRSERIIDVLRSREASTENKRKNNEEKKMNEEFEKNKFLSWLNKKFKKKKIDKVPQPRSQGSSMPLENTEIADKDINLMYMNNKVNENIVEISDELNILIEKARGLSVTIEGNNNFIPAVGGERRQDIWLSSGRKRKSENLTSSRGEDKSFNDHVNKKTAYLSSVDIFLIFICTIICITYILFHYGVL